MPIPVAQGHDRRVCPYPRARRVRRQLDDRRFADTQRIIGAMAARERGRGPLCVRRGTGQVRYCARLLAIRKPRRRASDCEGGGKAPDVKTGDALSTNAMSSSWPKTSVLVGARSIYGHRREQVGEMIFPCLTMVDLLGTRRWALSKHATTSSHCAVCRQRVSVPSRVSRVNQMPFSVPHARPGRPRPRPAQWSDGEIATSLAGLLWSRPWCRASMRVERTSSRNSAVRECEW